jgi:Ca-activated chloride channel family protein
MALIDSLADLRDFHFLRPAWLLALPLLWGLVAWLARRGSRDGDWSQLIDADLLPGLMLTQANAAPGAGSNAPWPWLTLAWTLGVLALAGPTWEQDAAPAYRAPAAWVVVLDLSPSMAAPDVPPNRATRARYAIDDLLTAAHGARVGLVVFSDEAYTVAPLTDDVATVRALLPPLAPGLLPSAGDQLAPALTRAGGLLEGSGATHGHVIVFSDGFADPAAAFVAAARLKAEGAVVDVVGVGTAGGAPLAASGGGFVADAGGQPELARLDVDRLQRLAGSGGGRYVDLTQLPSLIGSLDSASGPMAGSGATPSAAPNDVRVAHWRDAGAWLLPGVLFIVALLARRGWL